MYVYIRVCMSTYTHADVYIPKHKKMKEHGYFEEAYLLPARTLTEMILIFLIL
jgi:hypothetical protein